jgi:hypothetical protein
VEIDADYVVVGAGAAGMAFTDALVDHADVTVALVDRRDAPGGHWLDAYPFVRLHQASAFYGVASTLLGGGRIQADGPEQGLHERAGAPEIRDYYARVLGDRLLASGRVSFHGGQDLAEHTVRPGARLVDATYLSPLVPATTPPPFEAGEGAHVVPVNALPDLGATSQYVVVGSGKTATDACVWLLGQGVDPDAIRWVRPRDPWMLNRAVVQPDPAVFIGMAADTMEAAAAAATPEAMFVDLEERGVMLRVDRSVTPTMAKTPTLATWELDLLRSIEDVVRRGHLARVGRGRLHFADGSSVATADDAVVVHCAASGLPRRPPVPIWTTDAITLQPIRSGFPCFGAALAGFVEATFEDDGEKNRLCPSSPYSDRLTDWAEMQALGGRAARSFSADPSIKAWADGVALNPSRIPPDRRDDPVLLAATDRFRAAVEPGLARLAELAGLSA